MATFPTSVIDLSTTRGTAGDKLNSPDHITHHSTEDGEIEAIETKLGTGASTAASGKLLRGTGAGASAWDKDAPTGAIVGTTDTQTLTNKTLTTPTIADFTNANHDHGDANDGGQLVIAAIPDASITNAKLSTTAGELGAAWQGWTPTFGNLSGGTLNWAKYTQIGKDVRFRLKYTMVDNDDLSGDVTFSLPVSLNSDYGATEPLLCTVFFHDPGNNLYDGLLETIDSDTVRLRVKKADATYVTNANNLSSTVPFTWNTGDEIIIEASYEAA